MIVNTCGFIDSPVQESLDIIGETFALPPQGIKLTLKHYAYFKISEGCVHHCTLCIIPSMRGNLDSRSVGDVLGEAQRLVKAGVKELLVISQHTQYLRQC